jgi:hypothetical protein
MTQPSATAIVFEHMGSVKLDEPLSPDATSDITVALSACGRCGAVVLDEDLHGAWHDRMASATPARPR